MSCKTCGGNTCTCNSSSGTTYSPGQFQIVNNSSNCYGYKTQSLAAVFPDGTSYKESADKLRQYIISLESTRKLQDLSDVEFTRNVKKGDILIYNDTTGKWVLVDFLSGGEF